LLLAAAPADAADAPRDALGLVAVPPLARVTDLAGVLKPAEHQALQDQLAAYESARGSQIALVIVSTTQPEPIADFAQRVGDAWKIGRKGVGDGVLMAVAIDDRRVWISVARTLEGALPDVVVTRISREVIAPRFRQADYAGGLSAGLDAIFSRIDAEIADRNLPTPSGLPAARVDAGVDVVSILMGIVMAGIGIGAVLRRVLGVPGAMVAGGGAGVVAGSLLASLMLGSLAGIAVFVISVMAGRGGGAGRVLGSRRGGGRIFVPGGWSGGGGSSWGGGGGGWTSGGGGDFSGGGGGSSW